MGSKLVPIFAAMGGTVTRMPLVDDVHGYRLTVAGDDGRTYSYVHLNNDTPGTDAGRGPANQAYAPGLARGDRKSAASGKSVSVSVYLVVRGIVKKQK